MILQVNKNGIKSIMNSHVKTQRSMLSIYHGMYIKGAVSLNIKSSEKIIIELGYNEEIEMVDENSAIDLMEAIDQILSNQSTTEAFNCATGKSI